MGSKFISDIVRLEKELEEEKLKSGLILDTKRYEEKLLNQEQDYLARELEVLRKDTEELGFKLVDLKKENQYLEYRRVK